MAEAERTAAGSALTALVLDLFRLNNRMLTSGDKLVASLGLTSARWHVLGTIAASERPQPVAWLARDMGANRQNVQRIVNDLEKEGLVAFAANPHHRRAQLVVLTEKGRDTQKAAMRLQAPWASGLADGLEVVEIETTHRVIKTLLHKLEGGEEVGEEA
ncbi:MarR family winged helix-turn-helix transcriptional regulator [Rhizobium sp. CNPSo 3490]|uniref:MarR family winged helix-turn-helix transcriptional regulator n=1 Tax=Rhizobium sp. CNPSo 3490 TaxID=3021407 RepID=UPI002550D3F3|nr:MarR family winged helix-turn-helix transcriptional regulator [Rhizobium sp. CNPSo 3490]MDK4734824.1 MarR family winged helix-turn-helix transcriptional regulator [Rhizobium sp. CNPSo 3490]